MVHGMILILLLSIGLMPLSEFRYGASGISLSPLSSTDITGLTLFVWNGGVTGTACSPTICIDNIRVVPIY